MNNGVELLSSVVSPLADRLAKALMPTLQTASFGDPETEWAQLLILSELNARDLESAAEELEEQGLVELLRSVNGGYPPFDAIQPTPTLAATYDPAFSGTDPTADAYQLAKDLDSEVISDSVKAAAEHYGWQPRRMNPAVTVLISLGLIEIDDLCGCAPWLQFSMLPTRKLRRFVQQLS